MLQLAYSCAASLSTNLLYQPLHQPPIPASLPTSYTSLSTNLLYQPLHQPPIPASPPTSSDEIQGWESCIYRTYIPLLWRASLSFLLRTDQTALITIYHLSSSTPLLLHCIAIPPAALRLACCPSARQLLQFSSFHLQGRLQYGGLGSPLGRQCYHCI
jgi:hypothetical protein